MHNGQPLGDSTQEVLRHLHRLWGFDVHLESVSPDGTLVKSFACPPKTQDLTVEGIA